MKKLLCTSMLILMVALPAVADDKAKLTDELSGYLEFVEYGGGTIFAEQIPKGEYSKMMISDAREAQDGAGALILAEGVLAVIGRLEVPGAGALTGRCLVLEHLVEIVLGAAAQGRPRGCWLRRRAFALRAARRGRRTAPAPRARASSRCATTGSGRHRTAAGALGGRAGPAAV